MLTRAFCLMTAVAAAGCGGVADGPTPPSATPPADPIITMGDFSYSPSTLTVAAGTTVVLRNDGRIEHTAADVNAAGEITSRIIKPVPLATGQELRITFSKAGTYRYICTFHPTLMDGVVVVTD